MKNLRQIISGLAGAASNLIDGDLQISRPDSPDAAGFDPLEIDGVRAVCHTAWPVDAQLLGHWDDLSQLQPAGTPFHSPSWQWTAYRQLSALARPRVLTVHRGDQLLAVLLLALRSDGRLETPGAAVTDYLDPLIRDGTQVECMRAILSLLNHIWDRRVTELVLHNVRQDAPSRAALLNLVEGEGFSLEEAVVEHAPALQLAGSWDEYLAKLDGHERKEIRRKLNKAETKGNARFVRCETDAQIGPALDQALALMESCGGEKGDAVKKTLRPLLEAAAPDLIRRKRLDLITLWINDAPAACLLQFAGPFGPLLYNCGVDYAKKEWSPGVVAVAMAVREAIAARVPVYDLLRGREPYKYKLGAADRALYRITLKRR